MKYRLIGAFNLLSGILQILLPALMLFFTIPRLNSLYSQANFDVSSYITRAYIFGGLIILMGLANLFSGFKLFSAQKEKYFNFALIVLVLTFVLGGYFISSMVLSIILPIYKLTTSVN